MFESPDGARVFVDPRSLRLLDGTVLDYDTSLISKGFTFPLGVQISQAGPTGVTDSLELTLSQQGQALRKKKRHDGGRPQ